MYVRVKEIANWRMEKPGRNNEFRRALMDCEQDQYRRAVGCERISILRGPAEATHEVIEALQQSRASDGILQAPARTYTVTGSITSWIAVFASMAASRISSATWMPSRSSHATGRP